ncbi:hypothetical protein Patl1_33689 [Pistacia atlantica]|uniref:Uncharacterized protein n=1 Tax=Pistacia atlantica TaxID=434234 RepID=A0ACC0ZX72_9ROSI|nr:hypothetical protein Patl1_33689 [Pistacia atlantica]
MHCFEERPGYYKVLKFFHMHKLWEKHRYNPYIQLPKELKEMIFKHVKSKLEEYEKKEGNDSNLRDLNTRGSRVLKKYNELMPSSVLEWSVKEGLVKLYDVSPSYVSFPVASWDRPNQVTGYSS